MIRLGLNEAAPAMRLARPVTSRDGRVLLGQGAELTASLLDKLRGFDVHRLWIHDDRLPEIEPADTFSTKVRARLAVRLQEMVSGLGKDPTALRGILAGGVFEALVAEANEARHRSLPLPEEGDQEDSLTGHSVRVCLLAASLGARLMYSPEQLRNLAVGALIHDIGLHLKKGVDITRPWDMDLSCPEHAHLGFESVLHARHLSATISVVCLQHHERLDGGGWPRHLSGSAIHPFARITAVADRFDTMVCGPDNVLPHIAKQRLAEEAGAGLDADIVKLLLANTAPYPAGTPVRLNSEKQAIVIGLVSGNLDRPIVRVLASETEAYDLDLAASPDVDIECVRWSAPVMDQRATT